LLFPLPRHLPKRNSVRQVDAALQTGVSSGLDRVRFCDYCRGHAVTSNVSYVQRQWAPIGVPGLGNGEPIVP
jgi:hypothetical protein